MRAKSMRTARDEAVAGSPVRPTVSRRHCCSHAGRRRVRTRRVTDPKTTKQAEVLIEYGPFPGVDHIHGVTFDGRDAWIAVGDRLQAIAPDGTVGRSLPVRAQAGTA